MEDEETDRTASINAKEMEDAEVLMKSAEIDINEAEKTGADISQAKAFLEEAKAHFKDLNITQVRIAVKKARTAAADAKRFHRAELLIKHALPAIEDTRKAGANAMAAQDFIIKARESLGNKMYGEVSEHIRAAKREAKEAKRYHRASLLIENCKSVIANAKMAGANVTEAEGFLEEAKQALERKDYGVVSQLVKNAKNAATTLQKHKMVEELIAGVKPEVEELKRLGLNTEEIEGFLLEAETALNRRDYAEVRSLVRKIKRRIKKAIERKAANVLIANIDHVIQKAMASGQDVTQLKTFLERAKGAMEKMNHAEIESIISEVNKVAESMGISIGNLASDLFSKAKLVDLEKIDQVFSEAERKISVEMAKARITAMRDLLTSAKHLGIEGTQFLEILKKAEEAFEARDYDVIEEYKETFEDKLEEAKLQQKTQIVGSKIMDVRGLIITIKEQGIDVEESENHLAMAEQELDMHNFESAEEHVKQAEKTAKETHGKRDMEQKLESVKKLLSEAIESGVNVQEADELINQAQNELLSQNFERAQELIDQAKNTTSSIVNNFISGKAPKFSVKLPERGMEADTWNKCTVEISNIGDITAKNVNMRFKGNVETKGLEKIDKLEAGEKKRFEIGLMPKDAGDMDMDVLLTYQRVFDDTFYQLNLAKKIIADVTGTYLIDEVLLIHNSGIMISRASRKLEAEVDRDIFSGMFTAVQDFVKDSFKAAGEEGLKRMDFGANKIIIEHGHRIYLAAITVGGEPRYLPLYMVEVLREVQQEFGTALDEWRGDHSRLEGIDSVIEKLLHVTDEKGGEVVGFESGVVAQTIKVLEAAEESGVMANGQEEFVDEFIETMQTQGFDQALNLLENKGKEVDYEILMEAARTKITAMRELLYTAKESGVNEEEFLSLLDSAEKALNEGNFEAISEFKVTFEKKLEEAKFKQRTDIIQRRIKNGMVVVSQFKEKGINVDKPEELLALADSDYNNRNFRVAEEHVDSAEKFIEDLQRRLDVVVELESIRKTLSEVIDMKMDVGEANDLIAQAENEMNADNYSQAVELIERARNVTSSNVQHFIKGKYPKFSLKLPEEGMEADVWNKCIIEIANIGDLIAKNVDISFKGDVEVKGLDTIEKLEVGESKQFEIGVKPKDAGALDMDVLLAYQRAFDDTIYQLNLAKNIIADVTGTYTIEEVLLIHNSGILISQTSRKYDMEIDRDIFSGMFTAVQDFIKDSFQTNDEAGLKRMDFGGNKILIEHGHNIFLTAIVVGGEPRYLPLYMVEVLKEVEQQYGSVLDGWRGDYSTIEGIEDIISKLLQVTDDKGADVAGFETGVVSSTIKLIESAEAAGVSVGGQEAFVEEFIQTMKKDGFERAWNYLENKGAQVNKEISLEDAKTKMTAMRDLMESAKEWGMSEDDFISLLDDAEKAIEVENFNVLDEYMDNFEKKIQEAKVKQKTDIISRRIKNALVVISQFKEKGIDVEKPEEVLALADSEFNAQEYDKAEKDVDLAEKLAEELRKKHDIKIELETVKETLEEIKGMKVDVDEAYNLLVEAEKEMKADNINRAKELIEKARNLSSSSVKTYIEGKFPKFSVSLPCGGMEADFWNKYVIDIANEGDLSAKNIDIEFHGDVEVKGLDRIENLNAGEKKSLEIGLKPTKSGELDTNVLLTYQRAFDDTIYQLTLNKKLNIDESGTYSIEDVFLIHNRGVLVSRESRKMDMDVDSDIFSGMLTAIQDFIQDSFRKSEDVGLKRMDFGANKMMLEHGRFTYLAAVLTGGEPKYLPLFMLEVLKEVEQKYGQVLENWDGTYSDLEGLNDVIAKLMQVTDEKGADVEGFESSSVASTIKLIQAANEDGVNIVAPESFANQLINIIEKEGFENAWNFLEKTGREAEESSAEFKTKKEGMERLKHAFLGDVEDHIITDIGDSLENYLTIVDGVIEVIMGVRQEIGMNEATPIKRVAIKTSEDEVRDAIAKFEIPFLKKVKAKNLEILTPDTEWKGLNLELDPKKEIISRAYKQQASKVLTLLRYQSPWKIKESIEREGEYTLGVEGYPVKITSGMLSFKLNVPENVVVKEFDKGTIYIDKELTEEMKSEGIVDELIGYIKEMRKELNVKDEDYIETQVFVADKTAEFLDAKKEEIKSATRSYAVEFPFDNIFKSGNLGYYVVEKELSGEKAVIGIVVVEWEEG